MTEVSRILVLVFISSLAFFARNPRDILTPNELVTHGSVLEGKQVKVRGFVVITPHGRNIFDSKSSYEKGRGTCLGLSGSRQFTSKYRKRTETLSGIFHQHLCGPNDICLYWCGDAGISVDPS